MVGAGKGGWEGASYQTEGGGEVEEEYGKTAPLWEQLAETLRPVHSSERSGCFTTIISMLTSGGLFD